MSADTFRVGDRVVTVPGPDFGYTWERKRVGTVLSIQRYPDRTVMYEVEFDDEPESTPYGNPGEGWLLYPREIKHINNN